MFKKLIKIVIQILIIYIIYETGNFISRIISPYIVIPGNLIGMIVLLLLLSLNILKLSVIEETGSFLIKYMAFFFVPMAVGLIESYELIAGDIIKFMIVLVISCGCVMFVAGKTTDYLASFRKD
ncbi:CidA/LrgA family protein [Sedimentibacter sp. MB31-C6]|uniref:CidA/LrgA family protein n=1 Tax=Sedimentibacter sp. MB31-C6 TaxID=3109366 RepID=UPI002DDD1429|nr:CidA/LrgA family protein [Sedimentibacter sp. MB36-C1]WSI05447.1 CidA/LrgA family protein [Sedimentibacter sp. MB36-C1]